MAIPVPFFVCTVVFVCIFIQVLFLRQYMMLERLVRGVERDYAVVLEHQVKLQEDLWDLDARVDELDGALKNLRKDVAVLKDDVRDADRVGRDASFLAQDATKHFKRLAADLDVMTFRVEGVETYAIELGKQRSYGGLTSCARIIARSASDFRETLVGSIPGMHTAFPHLFFSEKDEHECESAERKCEYVEKPVCQGGSERVP